MSWADDDLTREFGRYEATARANGLAGAALTTYVDRPRRFLNWRIGQYRPQGTTSSGRPVPSAAVSTVELRNQAGTYVRALQAANLAQATVDTYERHALFFIRWLDGDFEPGARR